jgi:hypothetical protein
MRYTRRGWVATEKKTVRTYGGVWVITRCKHNAAAFFIDRMYHQQAAYIEKAHFFDRASINQSRERHV